MPLGVSVLISSRSYQKRSSDMEISSEGTFVSEEDLSESYLCSRILCWAECSRDSAQSDQREHFFHTLLFQQDRYRSQGRVIASLTRKQRDEEQLERSLRSSAEKGDGPHKLQGE
jgi:hypothetical protein